MNPRSPAALTFNSTPKTFGTDDVCITLRHVIHIISHHSFLSVPSVACTVVADATCREINNILCKDASPSGEGCKISLTRIFQTPGTYCVNITLGLPGGLALATTSVTVGNRIAKSRSFINLYALSLDHKVSDILTFTNVYNLFIQKTYAIFVFYNP